MAIELKKIDLLEEKSEVVQEVLTRKPTWMIRYGNSMIFVIVAIMLLLSWLIKYPDVVVAKITLTDTEPPVTLNARESGQIVLLVKDHDTIKKDSTIGFIQSSTDFNEAMELRSKLMHIHSTSDLFVDTVFSRSFQQYSNLGFIQASLNSFREAVTKAQHYHYYHSTRSKIQSLTTQLLAYEDLDTLLDRKLTTLDKQFLITQRDLDRDKKLFDQGAISERDLGIKEKELLQMQTLIENVQLEKQRNLITIVELQTEISQLVDTDVELRRSLQTSFQNAFKSLTTALDQWEEKYVLRSPVDGQVMLSDIWKSNQFVQSGSEVATIVPSAKSRIIGRAETPAYKAGKIREDQRVNILLDSYPFEEFGLLTGRITAISLAQKKEYYLVHIELPQQMMTTFGNELRFKPGMSGQAEIITKDVRLIERLFYQLTKAARPKYYEADLNTKPD